MNIFGVGLPEIAVIVGIALVIFGPKKLPEIGKNLGKTMKSLQKATSEFENELKKAVSESEETPDTANSKSGSQDISPEMNEKI